MDLRKRPQDTRPLRGSVEKCEHLLYSLEYSLESLYNRGLITPQEAHLRKQFLHDFKSRLNRANVILGQVDSLNTDKIDIGLPDMGPLSQAELKVMHFYLEERLQTIRDLYKNLYDYGPIVIQASEGRFGWLRSTFTLNRIKRVLDRLSRAVKHIDAKETTLDGFNRKLEATIGGQTGAGRLQSNVSGLMQLFDNIEATTHRIGKLKTLLAKEDSKINEMHDWLEKNSALKTEAQPRIPIPPAHLSKEIEKSIRPPTMQKLDENRERLHLARKYVEDILNQNQPHPPSIEGPFKPESYS